MLTETEARGLLQRAAATIDVRPGEPIAPVLRRRRHVVVPLVAAAAVLGAMVAGQLLGDGREAAHQPNHLPTPTSTGRAADADPVGVALVGQLVAFARGTTGAHFPGRAGVRLYSDGQFWSSLTASQAQNRDSYSACSGIAPAQCTASYLGGIALVQPYTVLDRVPSCVDPDRVVRPRTSGGTRTVFAFGAATDVCHAASVVQIRYDAPGRLVAVNVLMVRPRGTRVVAADATERVAANTFVDFAQGRTGRLPGDTGVALYNEGHPAGTLDAAQAGERAAYGLCGNDAQNQCGMSPVEILQTLTGPPVLSRSADCFSNAGLLGTRPGLDTVLITDHGRSACASTWAIELRYDDQGRIRAVNLLQNTG